MDQNNKKKKNFHRHFATPGLNLYWIIIAYIIIGWFYPVIGLIALIIHGVLYLLHEAYALRQPRSGVWLSASRLSEVRKMHLSLSYKDYVIKELIIDNCERC